MSVALPPVEPRDLWVALTFGCIVIAIVCFAIASAGPPHHKPASNTSIRVEQLPPPGVALLPFHLGGDE